MAKGIEESVFAVEAADFLKEVYAMFDEYSDEQLAAFIFDEPNESKFLALSYLGKSGRGHHRAERVRALVNDNFDARGSLLENVEY